MSDEDAETIDFEQQPWHGVDTRFWSKLASDLGPELRIP